jgi:hypothetical protein
MSLAAIWLMPLDRDRNHPTWQTIDQICPQKDAFCPMIGG